MLVKLEKPWQKHPAGAVIDVSDNVRDDLAGAGLIAQHHTPPAPKPKPKPKPKAKAKPKAARKILKTTF